MPYIAAYIEQAETTQGLYRLLKTGTKPEAQAALDAWVTSSGDKDPAHYRVFEVSTVYNPTAKGGGFLV